jgi:Flp pilus assembly protein TadB
MDNRYDPPFTGRRTTRAPYADLRIGDTERHQVDQELSAHFAEGRLDQAELDQRLAQVAAAKTRRQLAGVLADLPVLGEDQAPAPRRPVHTHPFLAVALVVLCLLAVAPAVGFAAHFVWPLWWVVLIVAFVAWRRHRRWRW